ncbi:MAG: DUF1554 domain-containing protein [Leptospiraceae bacterium]|nr:DUF1554 domain-containing protein [Leptospiraceae bacterium]
MKNINKILYITIFLSIFCKPTIDRTNFPFLFSLLNSKDASNSLTYPQSNIVIAMNMPVTITPTSNFSITSCTITPTLPVGLALDNSCIISGTPTGTQPVTSYSITANNSSPTATVVIQIEIVTAPSGLNYGGPYSFTNGIGIPSIFPTVTGTVTSYSITPSLPTGLSLNSGTGVISGVPNALSPSTGYTAVAANPAGNTTYNFTITVVEPVPSGLAYPGGPFSIYEFSAITLAPNVVGNITACSASPTLPAGLSLLQTSCKITGTPTTLQSSTTYTITPSNSGGAGAPITLAIAIVVNPFKKIFVTNSGYLPGTDFTNPSTADSLCNADAGKPGGGTYKAMIVVATARVACTTSNCSVGNLGEHIDWVFLPNTTYYQNDGVTPIASTTANGLMPAVFTNSISPSSSEYWTGLNSDWSTGLNNCVNWTTSAAQSSGGGFSPNNSTGLFTDSLGAVSCAAARKLLCVQQ